MSRGKAYERVGSPTRGGHCNESRFIDINAKPHLAVQSATSKLSSIHHLPAFYIGAGYNNYRSLCCLALTGHPSTDAHIPREGSTASEPSKECSTVRLSHTPLGEKLVRFIRAGLKMQDCVRYEYTAPNSVKVRALNSRKVAHISAQLATVGGGTRGFHHFASRKFGFEIQPRILTS